MTANKELNQHRIMCFIGGFLGVYAIIRCSGNFGSAQTANLIDLFCCLLGGNFIDFLFRFIGVVIYVIGISLCIFIRKKTSFNEHIYAILIDTICMVILPIIPQQTNVIVKLYPIFFAMASQWTVFHGNSKYNSSTIFSTNNLKQFLLSLWEYYYEKDKNHLERAIFFGNSLLFFHIGVCVCFILFHFIGSFSSLICIIAAASAFLLEFSEENVTEQEQEKAGSLQSI